MENLSKFIAELLGTALLMFGGCMGGLTWGKEANSYLSALSFGLVVMTLIQAYSAVSGAHFNPAVTLAALIFRVISLPVSIQLHTTHTHTYHLPIVKRNSNIF